ncbi:SRPBCC family protein [Candidatus Neomarinimicrobiota bacterium]
MREIVTEISINATPNKVWNVLTNFYKHPEWNPFITAISGNKNVGEQIIVRMRPPESKGMTLKPVISKFEKNKEFRWKGKLFFKGLFDGEHYFKLSDNKNGTTTFIHGEYFSGVLVGLLRKTLKNTEVGFELMNIALKKESEK